MNEIYYQIEKLFETGMRKNRHAGVKRKMKHISKEVSPENYHMLSCST